ncbi:hypothetical protein [Vibrio rumoiensis]|nr:hypothetical protein [Vibrio rumoiensis]
MFLVLADSDESQPNFGKQQWKAIVDEAIANKIYFQLPESYRQQ